MRPQMPLDSPIYVAGHSGLVGSGLMRRLRGEGFTNLLTASHRDLDLRDQAMVNRWFERNRPAFVIVAAGTVGGILANMSRPAEFLYDNLQIHANVVHAAYRAGVRRLLYLGSSCIYPREAPQPLREEYLLSGPFEPTNEPYAVAKVAGVKLCQAYRAQYGCDFISAIPTNLYGPHDRFDLQDGHVLPALLRKFARARRNGEKSVTIWGSGEPRREFLHVDDLADACLFLLRHYDGPEPINVGTGEDLTIRELALAIRAATGAEVELVFDPSKPDGMPRKQLDVSKIHRLGWQHRIGLEEGIAETYRWLVEHRDEARASE